jgi:hypothetical protein
VGNALHVWDLDPRAGYRPGRERRVAGTERLGDYVFHTLRPERFGGDSDGDRVHLLGTPAPPDPPGRERADVELWHVSFLLGRG